MTRCCNRLKRVLLMLSQNSLQDYITNNSYNVWRLYQIAMACLDIYNLITNKGKLNKYHLYWLGIDLFYIAFVQLSIFLINKVKRSREPIGMVSYLLFGFYHVELYIIFPSDAIIIINISLVGLFACMLFNDTVSTILKAWILHTLFYIYVIYTFSSRMPSDKTYIPQHSISKYLLFSYFICGFPIYYIIQLRYSNLIKTLILTRNIKSWEKVMNKINTAISIESSNEVRYRNDYYYHNLKNNLPCSSYLDSSQCSLGVPFIFQSDSKKFEVMKDEIYFSENVCNIWLAHDVTSISKAEERKYLHLLIATITHELRTPLNIMMAILNLLKDLVKEKDVELIEKGLLAAQMQECLINDILDVAKINNGSLEITHCYTNVRKLITSIYDMFRIKLEPHISFSVKITNPFPTMISIDERRFKQILLNLLSNSAKFTQTGFISIDASYQNGVLSCSVIDSGIGIPKEESAKIFTQFGTIKASSSINSAGSGLGLNLCKKLCLLMNGNIEFKSDPHIKTCFTFWFPADCKPSCDEIEIEMESPVESVLHVDDDYLNICILNKYASKMGLTYHSYIHAVDAIHNIKEGFKEFSMAFVDINMPDMDGYEVASKIRKMLPQVIIVALTGEERVNVKTKCMQAGFNIIIEKPISFDRYKSCVLAHALQ